MRILQTLVFSVVASVAFGGTVYWVLKSDQEWMTLDKTGAWESQDLCTGDDAAGKWKRIQLRADRTCSFWHCWREGQRQVWGTEQPGSWAFSEEGNLELQWNDGRVEAATLHSTEDDGIEILLTGETYRRMVPFDCY